MQPANSSLGVFLLFLAELHIMDSVEDNIVALVKEHPTGITLKKLVEYYEKKYHQKLTFPSGFDSVSSLIASLGNGLVIVGQKVMYNDSPCNTQVGVHTIYFLELNVSVNLCKSCSRLPVKMAILQVGFFTIASAQF